MKPAQIVNKIFAQLDQLSSRERKLVAMGATVVALLMVWFGLIEPALLTLKQAPANQAALLEKAALVMRAGQELDTLRGTRSRLADKLEERDIAIDLQQLLVKQGIADQASVVRTGAGEFQVQLHQVPALGFLAWLSQVESVLNLTVHKADVEKIEAGVLGGSLTLQVGGSLNNVGNVSSMP